MEPTLRMELFPADLDRTVAFYKRLGFELVRRDEGPPRYASLRLGAVLLGAAEAPPVDPEQRAYPVGTELVIEVDDLAEVRERVRAAGIEVVEDVQERPWGLTDFRLTDPDGYYFRFTTR